MRRVRAASAAAPPWWLNLSLFLAVASYSTLQSIVIPVLPDLAARYDAPPHQAAWLVSGFLMIGAAVTPIAGRLGDLYGHVRILVAVLLIFAAGALLAVLATSMWMLIAARMVQGLGAAAVALSFSIIKGRYPPARAPGAIGMISATMAGAAGVGLSLSGLVSTHLGLSAIFVVPLLVALGAIALLVPQLALDRRRPIAARTISWGGGLLFAIGMFVVLLAITRGNTWGWGSPATIATLVCGLAVMALWVAVELRAASPLVDVRLLASSRLARINLTTLLVGVVVFSTYTMMPVFLQAETSDGIGLGLDPTTTGLAMLPIAGMNFLSGSVAGPTASAIGSRNMLVLGVVMNAAALTSKIGRAHV